MRLKRGIMEERDREYIRFLERQIERALEELEGATGISLVDDEMITMACTILQEQYFDD
jgi:hypothetical protein